MGTTIHWELSSPPGSVKAVAPKLERVRRACLKLPFEEIGKVEHIPPRTCKTVPKRKKRKDDLYWAVFCARKYVPTGRGHQPVRPLEIVRLPLLAGEECDTTDLVLARYPGEEGWSSQGNTKTQYAVDFVESHLLVLAAHATEPTTIPATTPAVTPNACPTTVPANTPTPRPATAAIQSAKSFRIAFLSFPPIPSFPKIMS